MRFLSCLARFQHLLVSLAFLLMILVGVEPGLAQSPPATSKRQHHPPQPPPAVDQEQFLSYWTTETGWRSELQLRNNQATQDLTVTPVLRIADGTETALAPVTIKSREVKSIDLDTAIGTSAPQLIGTYGSVVLRYNSFSLSNLYAVEMIRDTGHAIAFHIDGVGESQEFQAGSREGIWWLPSNSANDYLILTNQGANTLALDLSLFDASGKPSTQKLTLAPRATNRLSVRHLVTTAGLTGSFGGVKLSTAAHAGSLNTLHVLFDEKAGFSAVLKMFDYDPKAQIKERDYAKTGMWTLRAPMLALSNPDAALAFPVGTTLHPQLFVRNTTAKTINASLLFNWRGDSTSGKASGPAFTLNSFETRRIDVAALQDGKTLPQDARWSSVILTTNSNPGELMAVAASYDATLRYGAQTPFSDQLSHQWAAGMWEVDPYHDSIITVGNGGTQPTQAAFAIFYNQGSQKYELEQTLQPDDQMWIDVGKLIRENVADKNGKTLPANLTSGSYEIREINHQRLATLFEGKVIYDRTYGHVTYGCAICCGFTSSFVLTFDPLNIPLPGSAPNGVDGFSSCDGIFEDVSDFFFGGWSTGSTAIATVDTYGTHTAVAVGSTNVLSTGSPPGTNQRAQCPPIARQVSGSDNVKIPDHLKVLSDKYQSVSSCPTTARRLIQYQSVDVNNAPVGTIQTKEQFASKSANTCNNGNPGTTETCSTDINGVFTDQLFIGCNSVGGSCGVTYTKQQWLWCPAGGGTPVVIATPGDDIVHNDSISVGGNTAGFPAGTCIYASGTIKPCL